jgi:NADPH:quinone reductase-like Zn-dependent oxidoreductase
MVEAAAVPEVFTTAWDNLCNRGRLARGETVLLHGGSSGVGTAGIQIARRRGCIVLVTARSARKLEACRALGAHYGIDSLQRPDFDVAISDLTGGESVDVILDIVGGSYLERNLRCLALEGRLVVIGLLGGATANLDLARMLSGRLTVTASTLRARFIDEKAVLARQMVAEVWPGFADRSLRPVIDRVLPLAQAAQAHALMESSEHIGKIVLTCTDM